MNVDSPSNPLVEGGCLESLTKGRAPTSPAEQLAKLSGLNLRTIQRLESGAKISTESMRSLAAAFEVPIESLLVGDPTPSQPILNGTGDDWKKAENGGIVRLEVGNQQDPLADVQLSAPRAQVVSDRSR